MTQRLGSNKTLTHACDLFKARPYYTFALKHAEQIEEKDMQFFIFYILL